MSIVTTKELRCDRCGIIDDFNIGETFQPALDILLRSRALEVGWGKAGRVSDPSGQKDVCTACMALGARTGKAPCDA